MCGIFCHISKNNKIEKDCFLNSLNLLEHRGPDNTGYLVKDFIALGSKRLKGSPKCPRTLNAQVMDITLKHLRDI